MFRLFNFLKTNSSRNRNSAMSARLRLEVLEDRVTPALTYHGGAILPKVETQALYLGSDWASGGPLNGQTTQLDNFLQATVSGSYMDMLTAAGFTGPNNTVVGRGSVLAGVIELGSNGWPAARQIVHVRVPARTR